MLNHLTWTESSQERPQQYFCSTLIKKKKAFEKLQDLSLQETNTSYDVHLSDIKWVALAACLAAQKTLKSQTLKNSGKKRVKK